MSSEPPPNTSPTAHRRLSTYAKSTGLPAPVIRALFDLHWNLDPIGREAKGWIRRGDTIDDPPQLKTIAEYLEVALDLKVTRDEAIASIVETHRATDPDELWRDFESGVAAKNGAALSQFATWHYLRGVTIQHLGGLEWRRDAYSIADIASALFRRVFRAGSVDRGDLFYCYCDLRFRLPSNAPTRPWVSDLVERLDAIASTAKLADLRKAMTGLVKGDKYFKHTALEALAYAGVLRVTEFDVEALFLPEHFHESCSHHYANEWAFPLRFWSERGGTLDPRRVPLR